MSHNHIHNNIKNSRFGSVVLLNLLISILEITIGIISGSLSLISDAFHNLEDTASIIISFFAWHISFRKPDKNKTYGYKRAEIIAAFINSIFLFAICVFLIVESVKRFYRPNEINSFLMILMALIAFIINLISAIILHKDSLKSINWKSAYLHMLGDALFSLAIILGAISIKKWSIYWIDPLLSIIMSLFIIFQTWSVFIKSLNILMQASAELDYSSIKNDIENIRGVRNIHHIHTWLTNEETIYFEAHIEVDDCLVSDSCIISAKIENILKDKYGIFHTTLQFETNRCNKKELFPS